MLTKNEEEEIIGLINNGIDLELLSFELDIPIDQINEYNKQLQIRKFAKQSINVGKEKEAIEKLEGYINGSENCIVEKMLLIKLKAHCDKRNVSDDELKQIEEERIKVGLSREIDEILEELNVQIPKIEVNDNESIKECSNEEQIEVIE